jgi:hypothetical protein
MRRKSKTYFGQVPLEIAIPKMESDGRAYWVEAAKNVESAKERVQALAKYFPGEYAIVNKKTGNKITFRPSEDDAAAGMSGQTVN